MLSHYRSYLSALAGLVLVTLASAAGDGGVTSAELVQMVILAAGMVTVYVLPNAPGFAHVKTAAEAITAGFVLIGGYLANDLEMTTSLWLNVAIAVGASLGILILPSVPPPPHPDAVEVTSRPG